MSERKIWTNPLFKFYGTSARLSGAAAGNCAHRYIGKVCCVLLVLADYIGPRPRARPSGFTLPAYDIKVSQYRPPGLYIGKDGFLSCYACILKLRLKWVFQWIEKSESRFKFKLPVPPTSGPAVAPENTPSQAHGRLSRIQVPQGLGVFPQMIIALIAETWYLAYDSDSTDRAASHPSCELDGQFTTWGANLDSWSFGLTNIFSNTRMGTSFGCLRKSEIIMADGQCRPISLGISDALWTCGIRKLTFWLDTCTDL